MAGPLEITGPYNAWHGAAFRGRWAGPRGAEPVVVLLGPEGASEEALGKARAASAAALDLRAPGVQPLLAVEKVGDRLGWVYAPIDGIGLLHTVGAESRALLSTRAAADLVARIAEILMAVGAHRNRGPEPSDIIVDARAGVFISGFAGPFPSPPAMRAPRGDEGDSAAVYRLGVLFAHLLSGVAPQAASEKSAHAALVRRALIRVMARPGPVLPERYGDWIRGMLAWEPTERPPLSSVPEGLRQVAAAVGGESLREWAGRHVSPLIERSLPGAGSAAPLPKDDEATDARTDHGPLIVDSAPPRRAKKAVSTVGFREGDAPIPADVEDEATQEVPTNLNLDHTAPVRAPVPTMPVRVGPPPEAIRELSLPSGFLQTPIEPPEIIEVRARPGGVSVAIYVLCVIILLACAAVLGLYLLLPPKNTAPIDEPVLEDALPMPSPKPHGL